MINKVILQDMLTHQPHMLENVTQHNAWFEIEARQTHYLGKILRNNLMIMLMEGRGARSW